MCGTFRILLSAFCGSKCLCPRLSLRAPCWILGHNYNPPLVAGEIAELGNVEPGGEGENHVVEPAPAVVEAQAAAAPGPWRNMRRRRVYADCTVAKRARLG